MRFAETEKQYREIESRLLRGEISEDEFLTETARLRVIDHHGRRWMLDGRTGRWYVHDGRQWVAAERPQDAQVRVPVGAPRPALPEAPTRANVATVTRDVPAVRPRVVRSQRPSLWILGLAALLILGCLIGGGTGAWVFFLRNRSAREAAIPTATIRAALVETYTPSPAPPTDLPAETVLLSQIATATDIPAASSSPSPVEPSPTPLPPTPTWTPIVLATSSPTPTASSTSTPEPTATRPIPTPTLKPTQAGPTPVPQPTNTPKPVPTPTPKAAALTGKIAFTVWNTTAGRYDLVVSRLDGSGRNVLGTGFRQPQFRPDGNLLAANGEGMPDMEHLVTMDPNGNNKVEVSDHTEDSFPAWHPGGGSLVFSSTSYGDGESRVGIVQSLPTKQGAWLPIGTTEIRGEYPTWMAGGRIVYHGCDFQGDTTACGLFWVAETGGPYHRLTNHASDTAPASSGTRIAFMSNRDGNWEVYVVNADGSGLKRLTNHTAHDGLPTWSPDGGSIAFVSTRDGAWAIWAMNADGTNQRKLFNLGGSYGNGANEWTTERISWAP